MSGSNRAELTDSAFIHAENIVNSVDVSLNLIHTPTSSLNEQDPVLAHDLPDYALNISNPQLGAEERLLSPLPNHPIFSDDDE